MLSNLLIGVEGLAVLREEYWDETPLSDTRRISFWRLSVSDPRLEWQLLLESDRSLEGPSPTSEADEERFAPFHKPPEVMLVSPAHSELVVLKFSAEFPRDSARIVSTSEHTSARLLKRGMGGPCMDGGIVWTTTD